MKQYSSTAMMFQSQTHHVS